MTRRVPNSLSIAIDAMADLMIATTTMAAASVGLATVCGWKGYPRSGQSTILALTIAVSAMFAFLFYAAGRLYWARWIPDSAVIAWSNLTPLFAAAATGWVFRLPNTPLWRRATLAGLLGLACLAAVLWPFLGIWLRPTLPAGHKVVRGITRQTSWATCSPAAASTFFRFSGIEATEAALIPLCLTDASGTPTLGLYRGVKRIANQQGRDAQAVLMSMDELEKNHAWPLLIMVKLPEAGFRESTYVTEWGWVPGLGHTVVILGRNEEGHYAIGDPAVGAELWSAADLNVLWHGDAIRLVTD
ncbi:cysteine peptidase family C39 domain-containing protein [Novipirellula artificiosorum]|nr:cysteine peptidase family C39 domain-containing protein [Novipirellula artificiosorum]